MNFIGGVNQLLRASGILRGDDDLLTTFSDIQHNAAMNIAILAIQSELGDLLSDRLIDYEKSASSITTTSGTRAYSLASDFVRFFGRNAMLYNSTDNLMLYEYPGGVDSLRESIYTYKTDAGQPQWWYWERSTTKKIGFFPVPDSAKTWEYDYEKDITVSASTDTLPFQTETEATAFIDMTLMRFKLMLTRQPLSGLQADPDRRSCKARLIDLMRHDNPKRHYGSRYV